MLALQQAPGVPREQGTSPTLGCGAPPGNEVPIPPSCGTVHPAPLASSLGIFLWGASGGIPTLLVAGAPKQRAWAPYPACPGPPKPCQGAPPWAALALGWLGGR